MEIKTYLSNAKHTGSIGVFLFEWNPGFINALIGSRFFIYLQFLHLVLCRVEAIKRLPVHHP